MGTEEKDEAMRQFKSGELQVLVATTVIEVGVDNPNATVMVIYDADRFGLAQLHQLLYPFNDYLGSIISTHCINSNFHKISSSY